MYNKFVLNVVLAVQIFLISKFVSVKFDTLLANYPSFIPRIMYISYFSTGEAPGSWEIKKYKDAKNIIKL